MKKYINDKSPFPQSIEEMDGVILNFEGHDRPRYVYPLNEEAGYLGLDTMDQPWFTPQFVSIDAGGTLTSSKYYSIIVVPIKADISAGGLPIYGEASPYSIPQTPAAADKKITYTIPVHPQLVIKECGVTIFFASFTVTDTEQAWETDVHVGRILKNIETGKQYTITANTDTTVTATNAIFSAGDRYQILVPTATARAIYAAEMAAVTDVDSARYYLRDVINDNTTTSFELTAFAESADEWSFAGNNLPPPNANSVKQLASLVFCGGGISESRGKAKIDTTTENSIQSTEGDTGTVGAVSKIEDDTQALTVDALIGMTLLNSANGEVAITDNTATEIYPALIGTTRFFKDDPYYVLDTLGAADVSENATFIPSTTELSFIATASPDATGTVDGKTDDTITYADSSGTADTSGEVSLKTTDTITYVDKSATAFLTGTVFAKTDDVITKWLDISGTPFYSGTVTGVTVGGNYYSILFNKTGFPAFFNVSSYSYVNAAGNSYGEMTSYITGSGFNISDTAPYIPSVGETVRIFAKPTASSSSLIGKYIKNSSGEISSKITANTTSQISAAAHGLVAGDALSVLSSNAGYTTNEFSGKLLYSSGTLIGRITANTTDTITVAAHGLSLLDTFDVFTGAWTVDQWKDAILHDGASIYGVIESNTVDTLTLTAHGLAVAAAFDITLGGWTISQHVGKFLLDGSLNILGRITANTKATITSNAVHGLVATDAFQINPTEVSSTVTFPTSFKVDGKTWTDDEHIGKLITFSTLGDKTILSNNADSIALTDISMPASAETFSIFGSGMTVSNPYDRSTDAGVQVKIARYTISGDLDNTNTFPTGTYAGDYLTIADSGEAGNNVTSALIIRAGSNGKWVEIENDSLVAAAAAANTTVTITRNHITGNVSGTNQTYFTEGMVDAKVKFANSGEKVFKITWADPIAQALGIDELYTDPVTTETTFEVFSNYPLYYSQSRNPHAFGAANIVDIYDITGFSSVGNSLLVFCKTSLWRVDVESLGATPVLISDNVRCPAQFSIVKGEKLTLFYDGTGISYTDGVSAQSLTSYKVKDYLANINKAEEANIRGVYDRENKRFEFSFPMGEDSQNNYGLHITEDSWNCYPFMRPDCNALWTNYSNGRLSVFHGTSGELEDGNGTVWEHTGTADATTTAEYVAASVAGNTITLTEESAIVAGESLTIYPIVSGGEYFHAICKTVSGYDVEFDSTYDLTELVAGDLVLSGYIPFDYGIKWTDFASPQYRHQVRALHIDVTEATGKLYVDHFLDMSEAVVSTSQFDLTPTTTKIVVPFRMGKGYKYGFRLRGYTATGIKISSFEIMYDTQV